MKELAGKLKLDKMPKKLWSHLTVDFIMKLLVVAGKDAILVVCNQLSKMAHFVATIEGMLAEGLVRLFWDNVWKLHGLPGSIVSDRGPHVKIIDSGLYFISSFHFSIFNNSG